MRDITVTQRWSGKASLERGGVNETRRMRQPAFTKRSKWP